MRCLVSILIHQLHAEQLRCCLQALADSRAKALADGVLDDCRLLLLYNGRLPAAAAEARINALVPVDLPTRLRCGLPNQGYAAGQNYALADDWSGHCDWWLAMNPDVLCMPDTLSQAFTYLRTAGQLLLAPRVFNWEGGGEQHLCRRFPSVLVLLARQFAGLRRLPGIGIEHRRYLYLDRDVASAWRDADVCSGCFMLMPMPLAHDLGGFDSGFFMYFEDYDLVRRAAAVGVPVHYRPEVVIRHAGGDAAGKGWQHRRWFVRSALRFFSRHGWQCWQVGASNRGGDA